MFQLGNDALKEVGKNCTGLKHLKLHKCQVNSKYGRIILFDAFAFVVNAIHTTDYRTKNAAFFLFLGFYLMNHFFLGNVRRF